VNRSCFSVRPCLCGEKMSFFQRLARQPRQLWVRQLNFQLHLWTGIILGVYLIVIGISGSILVFRAELEALSGLNPWHSRQAKEPFAEIGAVAAKLEAAYPHFRIVTISAPNETDPTFVAILQGRGRIKVASSADSGDVLGEFPARATWIDTVLELHETLLVRRNGRVLNGVGAAFLLLLSVTGLVVWWPGVRHWKRALTVDLRRNWRRINYDLHSAAGFWTLLIVSFWAVSGIYFGWPRQIFRFVNSLAPIVNARPPIIRLTPDPDAARPDLTSMARRASLIDPGTRLSGVAFPYGPRAPLEIRMRRGGGAGREYEDTIYWNPDTGEYLGTWRYGVNQSLGDWIIWSQVPLHFGTAWGFGVKVVWAAAGLAIPLLTISGALMYWNRSLRRKWKRLRKSRDQGSGMRDQGLEANVRLYKPC
jgi:uncharacterized iron-regulated membrane protein